jgi:hypothetical protein
MRGPALHGTFGLASFRSDSLLEKGRLLDTARATVS